MNHEQRATPLRCYLIRHAQTAWNTENRLQGHSDIPLSLLGRRQAKRLGARFAGVPLSAIVTSPLVRSHETARAIVEANGHRDELRIDAELAEMHLGDWEGLTPEEIDARYAGAYQRWKRRPSSVVIPGAEPLERFRARVMRAFQRILEGGEAGACAVVTHGGVIAAVLSEVLQADYDTVLRRVRLDNAGVTALELPASFSSPHILWINSTTHLDVLSPSADT